ncbi:MAG: UDP-N-acetylmuramate dehydrogenase [Actinobacteria bacterium]|nr:UDP-N-acetylmuramate dehydrogenase [Actinomycetota bacterium]
MGNRYINRALVILQKFLKENAVKDKILAKETTMRVGGPAAIFAIANSFEHLRIVLHTARDWDLPLFIIGKGSNLLVSDSGFSGIVLRLGGDFMLKRIKSTKVQAGAGISLSSLVQDTSKHSLCGLSFAIGIPGSLGGALVMNAGAYGECIGDLVKNVIVCTRDCEFKVLERDQLNFEYRNGNFDKDDIIVEATLVLSINDTYIIKRQMEEYFAKRRDSQPLQFPNAGSVFKNPQGIPAGKLIEDAGCKGMRIGGAEVSAKHANFIVNHGDATAADVYALLRSVQQRVLDHHGIVLEPEIKFLGEFNEVMIIPGKS